MYFSFSTERKRFFSVKIGTKKKNLRLYTCAYYEVVVAVRITLSPVCFLQHEKQQHQHCCVSRYQTNDEQLVVHSLPLSVYKRFLLIAEKTVTVAHPREHKRNFCIDDKLVKTHETAWF